MQYADCGEELHFGYIGFYKSLVYLTDSYYSSPNAPVSAFLTPACVDTITLAHLYQTIRHYQSILVTATVPKAGWK